MTDRQACGYIFESIVLDMLKKNGYIDVKKGKIRGRGAEHQIDAQGKLAIPTPFIYPIRLLSEVKCHDEAIDLTAIRNFVGVIKDISENYVIGAQGQRNTPNRYTDTGCFISVSSFTRPAQEYAWAHNIFIVSFNNVSFLKPIVTSIQNFVKHYPKNKLENIKVAELINDFSKIRKEENNVKEPNLDIGILDNVYPIILVGENNWLEHIDKMISLDRENVEAVKVERSDYEFDSRFDLFIYGSKVDFVLPKIIAKKIIDRIKSTEAGGRIFTIDVPFVSKRQKGTVRRIFKININLPREDADRYLKELKVFEKVNVKEHINIKIIQAK